MFPQNSFKIFLQTKIWSDFSGELGGNLRLFHCAESWSERESPLNKFDQTSPNTDVHGQDADEIPFCYKNKKLLKNGRNSAMIISYKAIWYSIQKRLPRGSRLPRSSRLHFLTQKLKFPLKHAEMLYRISKRNLAKRWYLKKPSSLSISSAFCPNPEFHWSISNRK